MKRIVLAYSGGLQSSDAIQWLLERFPGVEVVAVMVDLGARADLVEARERALSLGVVRCHVVDAREELARSCVLPALQAGALPANQSPLLAAFDRPVIAGRLVDLARMEAADAVACGAARAFDYSVFAQLVRALNPSIELIPCAPAAARQGADAAPQNVVANVWGRSVAIDFNEDGAAEASEDLYTLTRAPKDAPDQPAVLEIEFEKGLPVRVNGIEMLLLEMIESLETIAGAHGVGRTDSIVARPDGTKYREIAETPAGLMLQMAHGELQNFAITRELCRLVPDLGAVYRDLAESGKWFSDTRNALDAFTASIQPKVTGSIRLRLFKGDCRIVGRRLHHQSGQSISGTSLVRTV